jgi:hypothetical protein
VVLVVVVVVGERSATGSGGPDAAPWASRWAFSDALCVDDDHDDDDDHVTRAARVALSARPAPGYPAPR